MEKITGIVASKAKHTDKCIKEGTLRRMIQTLLRQGNVASKQIPGEEITGTVV